MEIEKEIQDIRDVQKEHSTILLRLESVIVDDKATDRVGYGTRIRNIEKYISSDKKAKWYISGLVAGLLMFIKWAYEKIY